MLTICLDESGNFEEKKQYKPLIVGGAIYIGEDVKEEEERLKNFYINACKEIEEELTKKEGRAISVEYPKNLHSTDNINGYESIPKKINKVLNKKVIDYIRKSGKYHITAMIKSFDIKETTEDEEVGIMVNFNKGANLYERMATKFIYNNIFYNPELSTLNDNVNLKLAKRTINASKGDELFDQLTSLGYSAKENLDGTHRFYVTDSATFRNSLSTKIYETNVDKNIEFTLEVESISYKDDKNMAFLYLADNVCDIIKNTCRELSGEFNPLKLTEEIKNKFGNNMFCFIHDDIDLIWTRIVEKVEEGDLIGTLEKIGELKNSPSKHKEFYKEFWLPKIEEKLPIIFNESLIDSYLGSLEYFFSKQVNEYEKGLEIANQLLTLLEESKIRNREQIKYKINEKIALAHNHRGAIDNALKHFNICEELKNSGISVMDYLSMKNRKTIAMTNACDFNEAINELNIQYRLYEIMEERDLEVAVALNMQSEKSYEISSKGKILSALGQNLAFLGKYDEAEKKFLEALEVFKDEVNKNVTRSYLKHMYIACNNREKYENLYSIKDIKTQYSEIFSHKRVDRYELLIFLKALNTFYVEEIQGDFVVDLMEKVNKLMKDPDFNQHPMELIIKHLSQLLHKKGCKNQGEKLIDKYIDIVHKSEFTIKAIIEKSKIDYLNLKMEDFHINNRMERDKISKKIMINIDNIKGICKSEKKAMEVFDELLKTDTSKVNECLRIINEKLSYMYN